MENQIVLKMARGTVTLSDKERAEWAIRAVKVYQKMGYTLTSFARAMTGRQDIRLELTPGMPRTDGQTIYYRPSLALGDPSPHRLSQCERRDADGHLLCPACMVRESVLQLMYHEIAHIAFGTLEKGGVLDRKKALKDGLIGIPEPGFSFIVSRTSTPEFQRADEYLLMAKLITPHLQFLQNCLEDARVDAAMFAEAPGTEKMFRSQTRRTFEGGFADLEGKALEWKDNPTDAQVIIGCFCIAEGYDYTGWLHPQVEQDLEDTVLRSELTEVTYAKKASETFSISLRVINRLWEMGYCDPPSEEFPQGPGQSEEQEEEQSGSADKEDAGSSDEQGESSEGPSGDEGGADTPDPGSEGTGSSDDTGDDQGDQAAGDGSPSDSGEGSDEPKADADGDSPDESAPEGSEQSPGDTPGDTGSAGEGDGPEASESPEDSGQGNERSEASGSEGVSEPSGDGSGDEGSDDEPGQSDSDTGEDGEAGGAGEEPADSGEQSGESDQAGQSDMDGEGSEPPSGDGGQGEGSTPEGTRDVDAETETDSGDELQGDAGEGAGGSEGGAGSDSGSDADADLRDAPDERPGDNEQDSLGDEGSDQSGDSESPDSSTGDIPGGTPDDGSDSTPGAGSGELPLPEPGSIEELSRILAEFTDHQHPEQDEDPDDFGGLGDEDPEHRILEEAIERNDKALDTAIIQGIFFENPSGTVTDVIVYTYNERHLAPAWKRDMGYVDMVRPIGDDWSPFKTDEAIMQPALAEMRRVFSENHRGGKLPNQKSGKINSRVLGTRAWSGDPRIFRKSTQPKRRSYMVLIGIDVSGSTAGSNIILSKKAAFAQAELCSRMGIDFEIWAHSAGITGSGDKGNKDYIFSLDMYQIKLKDEPWSEKIQERLTTIQSDSDNLDGHTIEFYRKRLMRSTATDKILLYYTDGHMPAANSREEKRVLLEEIKNYKQQGIVMLGVGINTESPKKFGMDTVRVSDTKDIKKVVKHLERHLLETNR